LHKKLVAALTIAIFVMTLAAIFVPTSASTESDTQKKPEFSGLAIVAFSALAASLYIVGRKKISLPSMKSTQTSILPHTRWAATLL